MLTTRAQPGMRRLADAFGRLAQVGGLDGPIERDTARSDWRQSLIRGHRRVLELYREVLATQAMLQAERTSIEDRIARIEAEISILLSGDTDSGSPKAASDPAGASGAGFHHPKPHENTAVQSRK